MKPELISILFEFGYVLIFGILGATNFLLDIPKEKGMESYRKARILLGCSLVTLAVYCFIKLLIMKEHSSYMNFWLLVTFTLIHTWLSFSALLFLLETPRYLVKNFLVDGGVPTVAMLICGMLGVILPGSQKWMQILFGCVFGIKCVYMVYVCLREYAKCTKELDNFYDESPDITWIKNLILLGAFMSAATIVAFYLPYIHLIYYLSIPVIYTYIVFRIINFAPKKIDAIRKQNLNATAPADQAAEKQPKSNNLADKIGPSVSNWIANKGFCTPELNIKDVALEIGTNQNYLSAYLNNHLEMTFQVWLNTLRIEEAKQILTNGEKISIEEVGIQVGFSQSYNFSKWFKTVTGTTPFRYRKQK